MTLKSEIKKINKHNKKCFYDSVKKQNELKLFLSYEQYDFWTKKMLMK